MRTLISERPWLLRVTRSLPGSRLTLTLIGSSFYPSELLSSLIEQHQLLQAGPRARRTGQSDPPGGDSPSSAAGPPGSARDLLLAAFLGQRPSGRR